MHEISIVYKIMEMIEGICRENNILKVNKVILNIGELTAIEKETLSFAFNSLKKNTNCSEALLEVNSIKAMAYCKICKKEFFISFVNRQCPNCHTYSDNIVSGKEILLYRIEGE